MSDAALVMRLRALTGAAVTDCRDALSDAGGNLDVAVHLLEAAGLTLDARLTAPEAPTAPTPAQDGSPWADTAPLRLVEIGGLRLFECAAEGPPLRHARDAVDLIASGMAHRADVIALPVSRLSPDFLPLSTRVAGDILQKFSNYGARLVIVGDLTAEIAASRALHDFVHESNQGDRVWFLPHMAALEARLAGG